MKLKFTKMQGCGNDYLYVNCMDGMIPEPGKISAYVSPRHLSVGSDGLICICPSDKADFRMRMFNADASEGMMCGNGSRCIAKFVYDKGLTQKNPITLETLSGIKTIAMDVADGKVVSATVDMGVPITDPSSIPMTWEKSICLDETITVTVDGAPLSLRGTGVSMGNPHFISRNGSMWNSLKSWMITMSSSVFGNAAVGRPLPVEPEPALLPIRPLPWAKPDAVTNSLPLKLSAGPCSSITAAMAI